MIWFACKQCGKRHGREENLAGTLVFCECGRGNRVPWSSTAAEPEPQEAQPAPRRSRDRRRLNPAYCLNHDETPKEAACAACRCSFCSACVVELQGQTLCGPCKNFRFGGRSRPARLPPLAVIAFMLALVSTVVGLFLIFAAIGLAVKMEAGTAGAMICCLVAALFAASELIVAGLALRQIDRQPALGGRSLAMTGATAGLLGMVWASAIAVFILARQMQG